MRLGRLATDLFTLKYQTKHFLSCEVSRKQDTEEKRWVSEITFTERNRLSGEVRKKNRGIKNSMKTEDSELDRTRNTMVINYFVYCYNVMCTDGWVSHLDQDSSGCVFTSLSVCILYI